MAAVLLLVGRGLESPDVVRRLLDVETNPLKPQYNMAPEVCPAYLANARRTFHSNSTVFLVSRTERHRCC